ncbi:MAG: hypothetical protein ABIJ19_02625 [Patescibacteria group bacterium]
MTPFKIPRKLAGDFHVELLEKLKVALKKLGGDLFLGQLLFFCFNVRHPFAVAALDTDELVTPEVRVGNIKVKTAFI